MSYFSNERKIGPAACFAVRHCPGAAGSLTHGSTAAPGAMISRALIIASSPEVDEVDGADGASQNLVAIAKKGKESMAIMRAFFDVLEFEFPEDMVKRYLSLNVAWVKSSVKGVQVGVRYSSKKTAKKISKAKQVDAKGRPKLVCNCFIAGEVLG